jgi:hypothetical protein
MSVYQRLLKGKVFLDTFLAIFVSDDLVANLALIFLLIQPINDTFGSEVKENGGIICY